MVTRTCEVTWLRSLLRDLGVNFTELAKLFCDNKAAIHIATWLRSLLRDLGVNFTQPTKLFCDNKVAIHIALNLVFCERTKHIEIDCYVVREKMQKGVIKTAYIRTKEQPTYMFTKPLSSVQFEVLLGKLGVINIYSNFKGSVEGKNLS